MFDPYAKYLIWLVQPGCFLTRYTLHQPWINLYLALSQQTLNINLGEVLFRFSKAGFKTPRDRYPDNIRLEEGLNESCSGTRGNGAGPVCVLRSLASPTS